MDEAVFIVYVCIASALAVVGVTGLVGDFRHFSDVEKQCKERGYIQDTKTRINCSVEEQVKPKPGVYRG
jgi:hypothetical protein